MDNNKRNLLKSIVAGAAIVQVPAQWTTPVIESALLPAHARTTCPPCTISNSLLLYDGAPGCGPTPPLYQTIQIGLDGEVCVGPVTPNNPGTNSALARITYSTNGFNALRMDIDVDTQSNGAGLGCSSTGGGSVTLTPPYTILDCGGNSRSMSIVIDLNIGSSMQVSSIGIT